MRIFFLSLVCFFSLVGASTAKNILNNFSKKYMTYRTIKGDFEYGLYNVNEEGESQKKSVRNGNFMLKRDKYVLKLRNPQVIFLNNGKKIVSLRPEDNEYELLDQEDVLFRPQDLFRNYAYDYDYSLKATYLTEYVIELHKKNSDNGLTVFLHLSKGYDLLKIIYSDDSQKQTQIVVSNLVYDLDISDEVFNFQPTDYPGIEQI